MMKQAREFPAFTVTPKAARSLAAGHPWVYAQEVLAAQPCENGALADVFSQKGSWLGTGLVSLQSKIRVRTMCLTKRSGAAACAMRGNTARR